MLFHNLLKECLEFAKYSWVQVQVQGKQRIVYTLFGNTLSWAEQINNN